MNTLPEWASDRLREGVVIPAHPLAQDSRGRFDLKHQRALTRYYHAAGSGGVAVGVHTTQFEIRLPQHGLFQPVLELAAETIRDCDQRTHRRTLLISGICGRTPQATREAALIRDLGYHAGLLSLGALKNENETALINHCRAVAREIPLFGFYLQPAVGGRVLSYRFWRRFLENPEVVAIKIAPFNRYQTLDVVRAVAESGRAREVALYTGNDDHILLDLLTEYQIPTAEGLCRVNIVGGLLGHWACWNRRAVELLEQCKKIRRKKKIAADVLALAEQITDCNAVFFDAANNFAGCIPGIHEVLRRQRLLTSTRCLNPSERLSHGQKQEIDRVLRAYPHLNDDEFVANHIDEWLK